MSWTTRRRGSRRRTTRWSWSSRTGGSATWRRPRPPSLPWAGSLCLWCWWAESQVNTLHIKKFKSTPHNKEIKSIPRDTSWKEFIYVYSRSGWATVTWGRWSNWTLTRRACTARATRPPGTSSSLSVSVSPNKNYHNLNWKYISSLAIFADLNTYLPCGSLDPADFQHELEAPRARLSLARAVLQEIPRQVVSILVSSFFVEIFLNFSLPKNYWTLTTMLISVFLCLYGSSLRFLRLFRVSLNPCHWTEIYLFDVMSSHKTFLIESNFLRWSSTWGARASHPKCPTSRIFPTTLWKKISTRDSTCRLNFLTSEWSIFPRLQTSYYCVPLWVRESHLRTVTKIVVILLCTTLIAIKPHIPACSLN